jgi:hypothetical protein
VTNGRNRVSLARNREFESISLQQRVGDELGTLYLGVNYFRDVNVTQIKYRLLVDAVNQLL